MRRRPFIPRHSTAWIALLAILLHAALPFMHGLQQTPARGFYTTLCAVGSPQQQRWVALDESPRPDADPLQTPRCPLCVAGAHFALQPPAQAVALLHADLLQPAPQPPAPSGLPRPASTAYAARAPPTLSA